MKSSDGNQFGLVVSKDELLILASFANHTPDNVAYWLKSHGLSVTSDIGDVGSDMHELIFKAVKDDYKNP